MDPDIIFWFLLILIFLVLSIKNIKGLSSKKIIREISTPLKFLAALIFGIALFIAWNYAFTGNYSMPQQDRYIIFFVIIIILILSFLIALNWSLNISSKMNLLKRRNKLTVITSLTLTFNCLIPFSLYCLAMFFDWLDLMGNCC